MPFPLSMIKRVVIFFSVLLICVFFFIFLLKDKKAQKTQQPSGISVNKRNFKEFNFSDTRSVTFHEPAFRLLPYGDSLFVFVDTSIFICSADLSAQRIQVVPGTKNDGNYYFFKSDSILAGFNISENKRYVKDANRLKSATGEGHLLQSIYTGGSFYGVSFIPQKSKENLVVIDNWDYKTNEIKKELVLNSYLKEYLKDCKECFESTLEGNFFRIDDRAFGFFFFRGGYFLINEQGQFSLRNSIVDYPFVPFQSKKVEMPGGMTAATCQADKDIWVQLCAAADSAHIYILSNITDKNADGRRVIDVYGRVNSQGYLYSFYMPNYKNEAPTSFLILQDYLITSYENGNVRSCKLSTTN